MKVLRLGMIVARTEAALCARSWLFRFYTVLVFAGILPADAILFIQGEAWSQLFMPWSLRAVPSSVPYATVMMLTMVGCLFLVFSAADWFRRESIFNTSASIHVRDFSNARYLAGKAAGLMAPFFLIQAVALTVVLILNIVFMDDVPVDWRAYILYPLIIAVPAQVFVTGLSLAVLTIAGHAHVALPMLAGAVLAPFFTEGGLFAQVLDYNTIHLPLLYSGFVGFGNAGDIMLHRGCFLLMGIGMTALGVMRFKRLPQSSSGGKTATVSAFVFILTGVTLGAVFLGGKIADMRMREHMQALNEEYVARPRARLTGCRLDVGHRGSTLAVEAVLTLANHCGTPLDRLCLSLNPGFTVKGITSNGQPLEYWRDAQILDVTPSTPLAPDDSCEITITYEGAPDDRTMYPDIADDEHLRPNRIFTHVIDKRYAFVNPDYLLLTPESLWYPVSGIPYGVVFPDADEKDFVEFTLDLSTGSSLTVISQADVVDNGNGTFTVNPDSKLTGLTLIAGEYEERSADIDGVAVRLFMRPGHDYYSRYFDGYGDIVVERLKQLKRDLEHEQGADYPYRRFLIVEAPAQYYAYVRPCRTNTDAVQPQMAIFREKGGFDRYVNFRTNVSSWSRTMRNTGQELDFRRIVSIMTDSMVARLFSTNENQPEIPTVERDIYLHRLIKPSFASHDRISYHIENQFNAFRSSFESDEFPVFNYLMEYYRTYGIASVNVLGHFNRMWEALLDEEITCMELGTTSFDTCLRTVTDRNTMSNAMALKTVSLLSMLESMTDRDSLRTVLDEFIASHAFEPVTLDTFDRVLKEKLGIGSFMQLMDSWYHDERLPFYDITDMMSTDISQDGREQYLVTFTITNHEDVQGVVSVDPSSTESMQAGMSYRRFIRFDGRETKEVGFITGEPVTVIVIHTICSRNLPIYYQSGFGDTPPRRDIEPFDGVRTIAYKLVEDNPGIITVDNLDSGFEIVNNPPYREEFMDYGFDQYPDGFIASIPDIPPSRWGKAVFDHAYGARRTAVYASHGPGDGAVRWTADIPVAGRYDLEYFVPYTRGVGTMALPEDHPDRGKPLFGDYSLSIGNDGDRYDIAFNPVENSNWQYVTTLDLEPGPASVTLSNKSSGRLIYADAIRWVKK